MTYKHLLATLLAAAALAGCSSLRTDAAAGSTSHGTKSCSYAGAAAECRGLHSG